MRTREHYDSELTAIHNQLSDLGSLTANAVRRALEALANQDCELAAHVRDDDHLIDEAHHALEERAITLIALQQPVARDLRNILASIAVSSELERVADYAKGIAKLVVGPEGSPPLQAPADLLRLGYAAHAVLDHALAALATGDEATARTLAGEEEQIDRLYKLIKDDLARGLVGHEAPGRAVDLLFVAHNFERIADRATNVAERVIYWASANTVQLNP